MNELLPLIQISVFKLGKIGWCVALRPGFPVSPSKTFKTKAEAMKLAKAIQKAAVSFSEVDENDDIRKLHSLIKQTLLGHVNSENQ